MPCFDNVSVARHANIYYEGRVTSRELSFAGGSRKTLGVMLPGEYSFGTSQPELMEIQQGSLDALLPEARTWRTFRAGESFRVPGNSSFALRVHEVVDYCCSYLPEQA